MYQLGKRKICQCSLLPSPALKIYTSDKRIFHYVCLEKAFIFITFLSCITENFVQHQTTCRGRNGYSIYNAFPGLSQFFSFLDISES